MPEPWTEVEDAGSLVIPFDGIDAAERDAAERAACARDLAMPRDRFTLRLDASGLSVAGERSATRTFDLDAMEGFESGRRIGVRKRDGTREDLPCALPVAASADRSARKRDLT
jgi:hypothetical protein